MGRWSRLPAAHSHFRRMTRTPMADEWTIRRARAAGAAAPCARSSVRAGVRFDAIPRARGCARGADAARRRSLRRVCSVSSGWRRPSPTMTPVGFAYADVLDDALQLEEPRRVAGVGPTRHRTGAGRGRRSTRPRARGLAAVDAHDLSGRGRGMRHSTPSRLSRVLAEAEISPGLAALLAMEARRGIAGGRCVWRCAATSGVV